MAPAAAPDSVPVHAAAKWRFAAARAGTHALIIWPPLAVAWVLTVGLRKHAIAFDFDHAYLPAARAVLAGHSPFPPATVAALAPRTAFVYPPLTAYLATPFTLLPRTEVDVLVSLLSIACVVATLLLIGVRDWRCHMIAFLWLPTYSAIQTANVSLLLAAGLALIWRYRDKSAIAAPITGALIALKLFLWPLVLWLAAARRARDGAGAAVSAAAFILAPWAAIGFAGVMEYPHLLNLLSRVEGRDGYTVSALLSGAMPMTAARAVGIAAGLAVIVTSLRIARRDERASFALAVAAVLLLSPIVDMHYFVLLVVVLGLFRPRLDWVWGLPLLLWVAPQVGNGATWQTGAALAVAAATVTLALGERRRPVSAVS